MATPRLPLPLRNALAELAIAALVEDDARDAVAWLVERAGAPSPAAARRLAAVHLIDPDDDALLPVHAAHAAAVGAHASRALRAADAHRRTVAAGADHLRAAVDRAAVLWDEQLFFEVHEVLEAVWKTAGGEARRALQGVIQVAVGFHHLAHGNRRGARTLMREGRARLRSAPLALPGLDGPALLAATAGWEEALAHSDTPRAGPPRFPRG